MLDNVNDNCVNVDDKYYHISRSKSDSEILHYKQRWSNFLSFNKLRKIFDHLETDTVHDPPMSFANQSNSCLHFNQSQTSNRKTRAKYDIRPLPRTNYSLCSLSFSSPKDNLFDLG